MVNITTLIKNDIKNIFRDKTLFFILFVPFIFILINRYAFPLIQLYLPVIHEYKLLVLFVFTSVGVLFPAMIVSFIMIDEKDLDLLKAFRVLPISTAYFLMYRLFFITIAGFVFSFGILYYSGFEVYSLIECYLLSLVFSLSAPFAGLIIITWAGNKIEAATFFKGITFLFIFPLVSVFIPGTIEELFYIIPNYWILQLMLKIPRNEAIWVPVLLVFILHLLLVIVMGIVFSRKNVY